MQFGFSWEKNYPYFFHFVPEASSSIHRPSLSVLVHHFSLHEDLTGIILRNLKLTDFFYVFLSLMYAEPGPWYQALQDHMKNLKESGV